MTCSLTYVTSSGWPCARSTCFVFVIWIYFVSLTLNCFDVVTLTFVYDMTLIDYVVTGMYFVCATLTCFFGVVTGCVASVIYSATLNDGETVTFAIVYVTLT